MIDNKEGVVNMAVSYWTGVGSREVPDDIAELQIRIGEVMAQKGYRLRSGNANGSDINFQRGASQYDERMDIYLPWASYNQELAIYGAKYITPNSSQMNKAGKLLIQTKVMDYWDKIKSSFQAMHSRNVYQVTGQGKEEYSRVCIYYAPLDKTGNVKGGTRTAAGLSKFYDIPTYNLFVESEKIELLERLGMN